MKIGFIGTGVMGKEIINNLLQANDEVHIYTRTKEKAQSLVENGAIWHPTASSVTAATDVIFTMVGYPKDVEEVYFGEYGIFKEAKQGKIVVDMTTSQPALAIQIAQHAKKLGMEALDAPVSGGDIGAQNGTLSIMIGGEKAAYEKISSLFDVIGENIVYQGPAGSGQHAKMCNQIAIATNMIGVCEAITYGRKAGLSIESVLKSISSGAAGSWSLTNLAPRILQGDQEPGFYIMHMIKDMGIALQEAERMNLNLPGLLLAKSMYDELSAKGFDLKGTQALIELYNE